TLAINDSPVNCPILHDVHRIEYMTYIFVDHNYQCYNQIYQNEFLPIHPKIGCFYHHKNFQPYNFILLLQNSLIYKL
ncbi:hypothetical protein, partial [Xenorhabdus bovienii]|uniref:hypothetical protein n=1 Tax=Xenorhabdus bovienii TaxID=40576 RepID=UPI001E61FB64